MTWVSNIPGDAYQGGRHPIHAVGDDHAGVLVQHHGIFFLGSGLSEVAPEEVGGEARRGLERIKKNLS